MVNRSTPPGILASRNLGAIMARLKKDSKHIMDNTQNEVTKAALAAGWILSTLEVSMNEEYTEAGKKKTKRVSLGKIEVPMPTLAAYEIKAEQAFETDDDGKVTEKLAYNENGIPIYADAKYDFLQSSIRAAIYIHARNRLISNTKELQPGKSFISSFEDMATLGDRDGTHLKNRAACIASFGGFIANQGKTPQVVDTWKRLMRDPQSMASQQEGMKAKAQQYIEAFIATLKPEEMDAYGNTITAMDEASQAATLSLENY